MNHPAVSGISVVIPNYNGHYLLAEIIPPLPEALKTTALPYEVSPRAWRFGWKCYYDHNTICRHKESVTIKTNVEKCF